MKIADEVAEELRKGGNLAEIRTKFRSASQVYEGLRTFLDESGRLVEERQADIQKTGEELSQIQAALEDVRVERERLSEEVGLLRAEKEQLGSEVNRLGDRRDCLKSEIHELREEGYTSDLLKKIKSVERRSGAELWSDLQTVARCRKLTVEAKGLAEKKRSLEADVKILESKKKETTEILRSEENKLDDFKLQAAAFKDALAVVGSFLEDGYCTDDLRSLKSGLDLVGIRKEPRTSISRLLEGLRKAKSLAELSQKLDEKRKELAVLNEALAAARKEVQTIESVVLNIIEQTRASSVKAIADVSARGVLAADDGAKDFQKRTEDAVSSIELQVQQTIQGLKRELEKLEQEKARLEQFLIPGRVLFGILESPDYLNSLSLPLVVQVFQRLQYWCESHVKDFTVQPSASICAQDCSLYPLFRYRLVVLVAFVSEGLRAFMAQQSKQNADGSDLSYLLRK